MAEETVVVRATENHKGTIIVVHGRGGTGKDFSEELFESQATSGETLRDILPGYKWIFPTAPERYSPVFKEDMHQWYDITSLEKPEYQSDVQVEGLKQSIKDLENLIRNEAAASPTGDVILLGISQGFTIITLTTLLGTPHIRALIGFCSWLPFESKIREAITLSKEDADSTLRHRGTLVSKSIADAIGLENPPSFQGYNELSIHLSHCEDDGVINIKLGHQLNDVLTQLGYDVDWHSFGEGGHWINEPQGINALKRFLLRNNLINPSPKSVDDT